MKALTLHPLYALAVTTGEKMIECRTWKTDYRGPLLICSSSKKFPGTIPGHAMCVVDLVDIKPFEEHMLDNAMMAQMPMNSYGWILSTNRLVKPFEVKGKFRLFDVPDDQIEVFDTVDTAALSAFMREYYKPLARIDDGTRAYWDSF